MPQMLTQTWEYDVQEVPNLATLRGLLTRLGAEGWELVNVVRGDRSGATGPAKTLRARKEDAFCVFFKRPCD